MKAWHIILLLICLVGSFITGYHVRGTCVKNAQVRSDTIVVIDTIRDSIPYPIYETVIQTVPELFPVYITLEGDTVREPIYVSVPITQKEYLSDNYHVWVSGYKPSLDSIDVFPKTTYITKQQSIRRWGLGIIGGYGIGKNGFSPYLGVGLYYKIW